MIDEAVGLTHGSAQISECVLATIQSFADKNTEELFESESNRRFASISRVALRKLIQMNQAGALIDLAVPPGNRLQALTRMSHKLSTALRYVGTGADFVGFATLQGVDPASPAHLLETRTSTRPPFARHEFW